ncbi:MAG: hypothetical protein K5829_14100 [Treponema sp.]|nr:hypothetical protein [Treponema sp.]
MKKIYKLFTTAAIFSTLLFSSCQEAVFSSIMKDVAEEEATMSGNILSITRYEVEGTEFITAAANNGLRYKLASGDEHGQWKSYSSLPFDLHAYSYYEASDHTGERIIKVLADDTNIYLITVEEKRNSDLGTSVPNAYNIWTKTMSLDASDPSAWEESTDGWTDITENYSRVNSVNDADVSTELLQYYENNDYYYTRFNVFSTNAPQNEHRRVFIRSGAGESSDTDTTSLYQYYEIDGTSVTELTESDINAATNITSLGYEFSTEGQLILDSTTTELSSIVIDSAAYLDDQIYFFNSYAVTSNETANNNSTYIFFGERNSEDLYYFPAQTPDESSTTGITTTPTKKILEAGEDISCLTLCNDALIIGRADYNSKTTYTSSGGVVKIELDNGCPLSSVLEGDDASTVSFSTNASSQLSSSYEIYTLLNTDPSKTELDSILYATIGYMGTGSSSSVSPKNIGMWSYYPNRQNWNRE